MKKALRKMNLEVGMFIYMDNKLIEVIKNDESIKKNLIFLYVRRFSPVLILKNYSWANIYIFKSFMKSKTHAHFFGFGNVLRRFKDKDPAVLKLLENKKF